MNLTDKPGRIFALVIFSPTLFIIGLRIRYCDLMSSNILLFLSLILFGYELFWIVTKPCEVREFN